MRNKIIHVICSLLILFLILSATGIINIPNYDIGAFEAAVWGVMVLALWYSETNYPSTAKNKTRTAKIIDITGNVLLVLMFLYLTEIITIPWFPKNGNSVMIIGAMIMAIIFSGAIYQRYINRKSNEK